MTGPRKLSQWNRDLAQAVDALGTDDFFPSIIDAVRGQVAISYPQVWLYHRELPPRVLYHNIPLAAVAAQIDQYLEGPYQEDPFYKTSMDRPRSTIYRLSRVSAGRLQDSTYYRAYYSQTGTVDEAVFLARLAGGDVINLSMMRLPSQGEFSDDEYLQLYVVADVVAALFRSHSQHGDFAARNLIQPGIDHQVELAFRTFGASLLSPREKSVLELMLRGYSTEVSAQRLGIARETLRRHRKNIYRKLDVNSQTDLFALFINSMACLAEAEGEDPLRIFMGIPGGA
jgi:DNA-binding CsgD family transcriptional regulator